MSSRASRGPSSPSSPSAPRPERRELRAVAGLAAACLLGAALAAWLMPAAFRATPSDVSRIGVLLEASRRPGFEPRVVAFGNSVVMSAFDGERLASALPGQPLCANFASTGQSLVESFLLQQDLPASAKAIVQLVTVTAEGSDEALQEQKYNTFYLHGFRPSEATLGALREIYAPRADEANEADGVVSLLERSDLAQRFQGRWALRQWIDTRVRTLLRSDLKLDSAESDLQHPQRYTQAVSAERIDRQIDGLLERYRMGRLRVSPESARLVERMRVRAAERGAQFLLLFPPLHPRVREAIGSELRAAIAAYRRSIPAAGDAPGDTGAGGLRVVDASELLAARHFVDSLHPNDAGAALVTDAIATALRAGD